MVVLENRDCSVCGYKKKSLVHEHATGSATKHSLPRCCSSRGCESGKTFVASKAGLGGGGYWCCQALSNVNTLDNFFPLYYDK